MNGRQLSSFGGRRARTSARIAQRAVTVLVVAALVGTAGAIVAAPAQAAILDRNSIEFDSATYGHPENGGTATVTLRRHDALGLPLSAPLLSRSTVRVRTAEGTAVNGEDYSAVDLEVVFRGGETTKTVPIPLVGDGRYEPDETVRLSLGPEVSGATLGPRTTATLTIANDDPAPTVSVAAPEPVAEGADVTFTVTLSPSADVPASVEYATVDGTAKAGTDYQPTSGRLTIPARSSSATVRVPTLDDDGSEGSETFGLQLSDPSHVTIETALATATVNDNDQPFLLSVDDPAPVAEGGTITFTLALSRPSTERVLMDYTTEDQSATAPADYEARSSTAAIDPGQSQTGIAVPTKRDDVAEPQETFALRLWNPRGAGIADGTGIGRIDPAANVPVLSIEDALPLTEGAAAAFRITLSAPSATSVQAKATPVTKTASVGADVEPTAKTVTIPTGQLSSTVEFPTMADSTREDTESFEVVLSDPQGATISRPVATAIILDDDQCQTVPADDRRRILDSWLGRLDPAKDDDGDGFTNGEELGPLAFDPVANPARFNPLIADVPKIEVQLKKDLAIALLDSLTEGEEVGRLVVAESERTTVGVDRDTDTTTEGHQVGATLEIGGGQTEGDPTWSVKGGFSYNYVKSTTKEHTVEVSEAARRLNREEINKIRSSGRQVNGGVLAVTAAVKNTGNVAYRFERAGLILRSRLHDRELAFDALQPNFDFGQGPTLSPGQEKEILFKIEGIGASDAIALAEDSSSLVISMGSDFELAEIGVGNINVGEGNFAQYQNTILQNTGALDLDYGPGRPVEKHLVSTTFLRDGGGHPLGLPLCDAVQILLGRELRALPPRDVRVGDGTASVSPLGAVGTSGPAAALLQADASVNAYWISNVDPASVGGRPVFGISDVRFRAGQGARLVYFKDTDKDGLDHRAETQAGTQDTNADSDGDLLSDRAEVEALWRVIIKDHTGAESRSYFVQTDPTKADTDGDGRTDAGEVLDFFDPTLTDTDGDGVPDGEDPRTSPSGITARYYGWHDDGGDRRPEFVDANLILSRLEKTVDGDWGATSLGTPDPASVPADYFLGRWTGRLVAPQEGSYAFGGRSDDGMRVYVNGTLVLDDWSNTEYGTPHFGAEVALTRGQEVPITVEYFEFNGPASVHLEYKKDGGPTQAVPQAWLLPDSQVPLAGASGLSGQYYFDADENRELTLGKKEERLLVARVDRTVDFNWGQGRPHALVPYDHFLVVWTGSIGLPGNAGEGEYEFGAQSNDGFRLTVGDESVQNWHDGSMTAPTFAPSVALKRGEKLPIRLEHYDWEGDASVRLWVRPKYAPHQAKIVPSEWLSPDPNVQSHVDHIDAGSVRLSNNEAGYGTWFKVTWSGGSCTSEELSGTEEHTCQIPNSAFDITVSIFMVGGGQIGRSVEFALPEHRCFRMVHGTTTTTAAYEETSC